MLLVFDIGNTNMVLGIFDGSNLIHHWRISTDKNKTADEYQVLFYNLFFYSHLDISQITSAALSSVVPPLMPLLEDAIDKCFHVRPLVIEPGVKTGMPIRFENPREVGADRIVNGIAAYELYGGPAIVVDFGTATTFDAISADGEYLGGAIAPGIGISTDALFQRAAKLPRVELVKPPHVIGKNTVSGMQAGIVYGFIGQVEGMVVRMQRELKSKAIVIATGGLAELIGKESAVIDKVDPFLTLTGLRIVHERNTRK